MTVVGMMNDDGRGNRRGIGKPSQQYYRPGSGALKKSGHDCPGNVEEVYEGPRGRGRRHRNPPGFRKSVEDLSYHLSSTNLSSNNLDAPETANFERRRSINSGRHRNYSNSRYSNDDGDGMNRSRDTRSMEPSINTDRDKPGTGYGKPPSGRGSVGGFFPYNIEALPPRLQKKALADAQKRDPSLGFGGYTPADVNNWSQTLPVRGRGRLRDAENFNHEHFLRNYEASDGSRPTPRSMSASTGISNLSHHIENWAAATNGQTQYHSHSDDYITPNQPIYTPQQEFTSLDVTQLHYEDHQMTVEDKSEKREPDLADYLNQTNHENNEKDFDKHNADTASEIKEPEVASHSWFEEAELQNKRLGIDNLIEDFMPTKQETIEEPASLTKKKARGSGKRRSKREKSGETQPRSHRGGRDRNKPDSKDHRDPRDPGGSETSKDRPAANPNRSQKERGGFDHNAGRPRERRESCRSNGSYNDSNRDEGWRERRPPVREQNIMSQSWRSCSRETSQDRRIYSRGTSREPSGSRASSPRDLDGFRIPHSPLPHHQNGRNSRNQGRERGGAERARARNASAESGGGAGGRSPPRRPRGGRHRRGPREEAPAGGAGGAGGPGGAAAWRGDRGTQIEAIRRCLGRVAAAQRGADAPPAPPPGLLVLPERAPAADDVRRADRNTRSHLLSGSNANQQKTLYDPHNPSKPIVVDYESSSRDSHIDSQPGRRRDLASEGKVVHAGTLQLLRDAEQCDRRLARALAAGASGLAADWDAVSQLRRRLQDIQATLLISDLKYSQEKNIEHDFWKSLYYNFIEIFRRAMGQDEVNKGRYCKVINEIIDDGNKYFEKLTEAIEETYKFKVDDYLIENYVAPPKGFVRLALISVQKLYIFLGDLARYKEQVNDTINYSRSKVWYTKANQINPKNGRPYNQLAILAFYARRKFDAVYYYMRSIMSSNPFHSARESLISLFDENRKKYETAERKRRAERDARKAAIAPGPSGSAQPGGNTRKGLRREIWLRPDGGKTTTLLNEADARDSEEEELERMSFVELNKRFITSYLHVHGKLITKIGMETFMESAQQMLRQFRALLRHQPLPINNTRLLRLMALNIFAIEVAQIKDTIRLEGAACYRSPVQEKALGVALLMSGALAERTCALLTDEQDDPMLNEDVNVMMPAIKIWCDWLLCHSDMWNPPPSCDDYNLINMDHWDWLAKLMNILEDLSDKMEPLENDPKDGYEAVRLPEDATLAGFTPLLLSEPALAFRVVRGALAEERARATLRARRLLFVGTQYLCGVEPPALRHQATAAGRMHYVSAVRHDDRDAVTTTAELKVDDDEKENQDASCVSEEEDVASECVPEGVVGDATTRRLLRRKGQLEHRQRSMERRKKKMAELLRHGQLSVELEVRPRFLVPDTNCFIDHLHLLQRIAEPPANTLSPFYTLAVPLIVVSELEGLCRASGAVGTAATAALTWLRSGPQRALRFLTTRGSLLASPAFTSESDALPPPATNDDRVLAASLSLSQVHENTAVESEVPPDHSGSVATSAGVRRVCRNVVLLTDDRNLRVKALASELPVRDLPAFMRWANKDEH